MNFWVKSEGGKFYPLIPPPTTHKHRYAWVTKNDHLTIPVYVASSSGWEKRRIPGRILSLILDLGHRQ